MEQPDGPRPKVARVTCKACRTSKSKCDLELGLETCSRCARLHICCERNAPSQRGRHHNSGVNRMGAKLKALRATGESTAGMPGPQHSSPAPSPLVRKMMNHWVLAKDRLKASGSKTLNCFFVRRYLGMAMRNESWELAQHSLNVAKDLDLSLEETMHSLAAVRLEVSMEQREGFLSGIPPEVLADICEWYDHPQMPAVMFLIDEDGSLRVLANVPMRDLFRSLGAEHLMEKMIEGGDETLAMHIWLNGFKDDNMVVQLFLSLARQMAEEEDRGGSGTGLFQGRTPRPTSVTVHGREAGPFYVHARVSMARGLMWGWKGLALEPCLGLVDAPLSSQSLLKADAGPLDDPQTGEDALLELAESVVKGDLTVGMDFVEGLFVDDCDAPACVGTVADAERRPDSPPCDEA